MIDINHAPPCGLICAECEFLGEQCKGCGIVKGKPFWTAEMPTGICPFYDCCINQKKLEHCGLCEDMPCKLFLEIRDPNLSDEAFHESLGNRKEDLKRRAVLGTEAWLKEMDGDK